MRRKEYTITSPAAAEALSLACWPTLAASLAPCFAAPAALSYVEVLRIQFGCFTSNLKKMKLILTEKNQEQLKLMLIMDIYLNNSWDIGRNLTAQI